MQIEHAVELSHGKADWSVIDGDIDPIHAEYLRKTRPYEETWIHYQWCYGLESNWTSKVFQMFSGGLDAIEDHLSVEWVF